MNSETTIKFSIIIPTLNEEHYVGTLLHALCKQDHKDFEVTVVDANSIDKTREVVEKFKDRLDLKFVISPKRGVSQQRNYGVELSKNKHLIFFDADVDPEPRFLSKIADYIKKKPADVLTSWNIPISEKLIDEFIYWVHNRVILEGIKRIAPGAVGTFIYVRREVFDDIGGFDETMNFGEDFDLAKRIFDKGYKYILLKDPKIRVSVRRFDMEGRSQMVWKNIKATFLYTRKGMKGIQGKFKHEFGKF
jgi:glycosyltransferase involved in cell wall biosynthesis